MGHTYLALLDGENPRLSLTELKAVIKAEDPNSVIIENTDRTAVFKTNANQNKLVQRLALTHWIADYHYTTPVTELAGINLNWMVQDKPDKTFKIDVERIDTTADRNEVIKTLAKNVEGQADLVNPNIEFIVLVHNDLAFISSDPIHQNKTAFSQRNVKNRPYFDPVSINAKPARAMVNLSGAKEGDTVLDPFCGIGGINIEAALMNMKTIGIELEDRRAKGAIENLEKYSTNANYKVITGDCLTTKIGQVDCIVTDPPYGLSSSTFGTEAQDLYEKFLDAIPENYPFSTGLVMTAPFHFHKTLEEKGYRVKKAFEIRVHKSLTRRIYTCEMRN
ncbi:MAG: hypothetical protein GOV15_04445 [Candidatus Diapherotrites archaeon]|nr:hypothetical protein [Candidatus Diapherotrites archaeon]